MTRVKRGSSTRKRHKKVLQLTEGFRGAHSVLFSVANQQAMKALRYAYRHRATRKRDFRSLWIHRINAAVRHHGLTYSRFISSLKKENIQLNRKVLAQLAILDPTSFLQLIKVATNPAS